MSVMSGAQRSPAPVDQSGSAGWLSTINPAVKVLAILAPMTALLFTRDVFTPAVVLAGATIAVLTGFKTRARTLVIGTFAVALVVAWMTLFFALLVDTSRLADARQIELGPLSFPRQALQTGLATALRFVALMALALLGSVGTTTGQLASALVHQVRVPYRFAYGTVATLRFVPRYKTDVGTLRAAHRARGIADMPGPIGALRRAGRSAVPLLASGVRHAERLSLAMDARGFGAFPQRTDRNPATLRVRDWVFLAVVWGGIAAAYLLSAQLGLLQMTSTLYRP